MENTHSRRYIYLDLDLKRGHKVWTFLSEGSLCDSEIVYRPNSSMRSKNLVTYALLLLRSLKGYFFWVFLLFGSRESDFVYVRNDLIAGLVCVLLGRKYIFVYSHPKYAFSRGFVGKILGWFEVYLVRRSVHVLPITKRLLFDVSSSRVSYSEMPIPLGEWKGGCKGEGLVYIGSLASNRGLEDLMYRLHKKLNLSIDLYSHSADFVVTGVIYRGSYSRVNETEVLRQYRFGLFLLNRAVQFYSSSPIKIKDYIEHGLTVISAKGIVEEVDKLINAGIVLDYTSENFLKSFNRIAQMSELEYKKFSISNYSKASKILYSFDEISGLFSKIENTE